MYSKDNFEVKVFSKYYLLENYRITLSSFECLVINIHFLILHVVSQDIVTNIDLWNQYFQKGIYGFKISLFYVSRCFNKTLSFK